MSLVRTIAGVLGVGLLGIAAWCGWRAHTCSREFEEAFTVTPAAGEVDLSRKGVTRLPFESAYPIAHGIGLFVVLPQEPTAGGDRWPVECEGLGGRLSITDASGEEIWTEAIDPCLSSMPPDSPSATTDGPRAIELAMVRVLPRGQQTLTVDVSRPARRLAGMPQRLVARYRLCGLEKMPAFVMGVGAIGSGVLALVCGLVWLAGRGKPEVMESNGAGSSASTSAGPAQ